MPVQEHMGFVLILGTFVCYCGALAIIGTLYKFWAPHRTCGLNIFFITFTLYLALIFTVISVSPWRLETAGLLTSGVVFLYCAWIVWSALASEPDSATCTYDGAKGTTVQKVSLHFFLCHSHVHLLQGQCLLGLLLRQPQQALSHMEAAVGTGS